MGSRPPQHWVVNNKRLAQCYRSGTYRLCASCETCIILRHPHCPEGLRGFSDLSGRQQTVCAIYAQSVAHTPDPRQRA